MNGETIADLLIVALVFGLLITIVIVFAKGYKSTGSGGSITTMAGATSEMLSEDKKRAMEILVEQKAKKKMEEQETGEPKDKVN